MKTYIGTKIIQAEPAFRIDGEIYPESGPVPRSMNREEGYRVHYPDGYESWSPKDVFEQAYLPLTVNPDLRTDAPSISQQMVDDFILETWTQTMGDKTTVVRALLRNGFEIVESSACVSAENYDEKLGREICLGKIKDKVWFLLGFLLQTAVHGVKKAKTEAGRPAYAMTFGMAIEAAKKEGAANKFKGKTAGLKLPLRDGDEERADDYPEYTGMYFMNANSNRKPILLDQDNNEILDQTEMYSGCWGQASINFFPFNSNGNKGIAVGLNALKKKRDDEPLGGTITVDSAISDFEDSDDGFDDDLLG